MKLHFIFDKALGHVNPGFIECEDDMGFSLKVGEWFENDDGTVELLVDTDNFIGCSIANDVHKMWRNKA